MTHCHSIIWQPIKTLLTQPYTYESSLSWHYTCLLQNCNIPILPYIWLRDARIICFLALKYLPFTQTTICKITNSYFPDLSKLFFFTTHFLFPTCNICARSTWKCGVSIDQRLRVSTCANIALTITKNKNCCEKNQHLDSKLFVMHFLPI